MRHQHSRRKTVSNRQFKKSLWTDYSGPSLTVLQDVKSMKYLVIPHGRYPGRQPVHFFMSKSDAQSVLQEILEVSLEIGSRSVIPVKVKLLQACRSIAADKTPGNADSFVLHSPNEVFDFVRSK